ncbi:hypothetical protein [Arenibacter algicola]|uniref:Uncharacterized protein n=1 Tax=Arenibacter algicola TaxID=616991 RepID=A0A221UVP9_9FLAO|nr:hypothetical protein [Arenibacter algicola]ASO05425.1 hypothetical protein AREALGSMS7_01964 [Arenibacter algicola]
MKKNILILFLVGLTTSYGQELDGVWMSYNNRIIDSSIAYSKGGEGILINFDNSTMGHIGSDTIINVHLTFKMKKVKLKVEGIKGKGKLKKFGNDSLEMDSGRNMVDVFRKLDLNNELNMSLEEVIDFFVKNRFEPLNDFMDIEFTRDKYWKDKWLARGRERLNLLNHTWENDSGFWILKEIDKNYFLVFTLGQVEKQNFYQILDINEKSIKLKPLQETDFGLKNITELKTCL